jgi:UDP-2,4-diacetamido-2,4,6-trideoxy-beta-L-altropyranose hydrolase
MIMTDNVKFLIFTDCGRDIGFGHFNRCNSIKLELLKRGAEVVIEIFDDRENSNLGIDWLDKWPEVINSYQPTHILIDSFRVNEEFFEKLTNLQSNVFIIDDFPERNHKRGTVINWTVDADIESFLPRHSNVKYLLGTKYCCIRPQFSKPVNINSFEIDTVLVTFGGSDIRNLSLPLVSHLCFNYPNLKVNLVLGLGAKVHDFSSISNVNVYHNCSADQMCELMDKSEFALCGGGQTLYEMASRGLPSIIIPLIDNQLADIRGFVNRGFGLQVKNWQDASLIISIDAAIARIRNPEVRLNQAKKGVELVDGNGLMRLVTELLYQ